MRVASEVCSEGSSRSNRPVAITSLIDRYRNETYKLFASTSHLSANCGLPPRGADRVRTQPQWSCHRSLRCAGPRRTHSIARPRWGTAQGHRRLGQVFVSVAPAGQVPCSCHREGFYGSSKAGPRDHRAGGIRCAVDDPGRGSSLLNVEDEANKVNADPGSNGGALILREKELATLSDDPDELSQQLQAMAGPGGGPNGGQIYIDGFTGGNLPSKASIREIRINSNPFSPEYDRPGFGRIEIFTKPGTDAIHGQAFVQYNKEALNSRSPLLAQSQRPPYKQDFFGFNLGGPLKKQKASFAFDAQRRNTTENAFILATDLDSNLNRQTINQAILTPQ